VIEVPVDPKQVEEWQAASDRGHMPWRVNPVGVAFAFLVDTTGDKDEAYPDRDGSIYPRN